jgi:DNA-binding transcriptional ArsR family regulator
VPPFLARRPGSASSGTKWPKAAAKITDDLDVLLAFYDYAASPQFYFLEAQFLRLDVCLYRHMMAPMARAATTSDVFNAIAEPQRREILVLLRAGERPVTELAQELGMAQPGASKHLRVLREVGLVRDRKAGKQRLYGLDARGLRPVHEWTGGFERFWNESFDRLDAYVQDLKQARQEE